MARIVLHGDEDRAADAIGAALQMYQSGSVGGQLSDGTVVQIDRYSDVVNIIAEFLPQYQLLLPFAVEGVGAYTEYLLGYSHRRDALLPSAVVELYDHSGTGWDLGSMDFQYMSDGMALLAVAHSTYMQTPSPGEGVAARTSLSITGVPEDLLTNAIDIGTPLGVRSANVVVAGVGCVKPPIITEWFTASPYGLVRSSPRKAAVCAAMVRQLSGTVYEQEYTADSAQRFMGYSLCVTSLVHLVATEGAAPVAVIFDLGLDVIYEYDRATGGPPLYPDGSGVTVPTPCVIPLGNHSVLVVTRSQVVNAQKFFGRDFTIKAFNIAGESPSGYVASTTSLISTYFGSDISFTDPAYTFPAMGYARNSAVFKHYGFFFELARNCRNPVPLASGEVLVFTKITYNMWPGELGYPGYSEQYVCLACDSTGIYPRGVVDSYVGDCFNAHNTTYGGLVDVVWDYAYIGAVSVGGGNVIVFIRVTKVWPYVADEGILRFTSSDSGATWSAATHISNDVAGTSPYVMTAPRWVGPSEGITTGLEDAKLIAAIYKRTSNGDGTETIQDTRLVRSDDGGSTWVSAPDASGTKSLDVLDAYAAYNPVAGFGSIHHTGNHEEGYAPSPYTNVPAFFGTAGAASRSPANDPNL
jgi:hypothetical protein